MLLECGSGIERREGRSVEHHAGRLGGIGGRDVELWLGEIGTVADDEAERHAGLLLDAEGGLDRLRDAGHTVDVQEGLSPEQLLEAIKGAHALIIRSATTIGAQVVRMEGKIGCLKAGAFADLIVVDGNPLKNLKLFQEEGKHLSAIMKGGRFHKNRLN